MLALEERRQRLQTDLANVMGLLSSLKDSFFEDVVPRASAVISRATTPPPSRPSQRRRRTPRGALKEQIMTALERAGAAGVYVKDLATELAIKPVNIHSWFHSTTKRNPAIRKISGGHYRLVSKGGSAPKTSRASSGRKKTPVTSSISSGNNNNNKKIDRRKKGGTSQGPRGALSAKILRQLESAGKNGVTVRAIAERIGAKNKNIYIWFATTGKKNSAIKKVGPATYRLAR
jgi:hypothetical protein